jgi:hypothetical protein
MRPKVAYNSVVWSPCVNHLIDSLEIVQRNFTIRIPSIANLTYVARSVVLNLETLTLRRLGFDLIFHYKVFNHVTPFDACTISSLILRHPHSSLSPTGNPDSRNLFQSRVNFFRSIDAWNYLPDNSRILQSLPAYRPKHDLETLDFSKFLKVLSMMSILNSVRFILFHMFLDNRRYCLNLLYANSINFMGDCNACSRLPLVHVKNCN